MPVCNIIRKMTVFPYFLIVTCFTKSLCHYCFSTWSWYVMCSNMIKITSRLKIAFVIYPAVDYYWMHWNALHEAVQPVVYLCIFFQKNLVCHKLEQVNSLCTIVCIHCRSENTVNMKQTVCSLIFSESCFCFTELRIFQVLAGGFRCQIFVQIAKQ